MTALEKMLHRAQDGKIAAQSRISAARKAGARRKHILQLHRRAALAGRIAEAASRKKTKPRAAHAQKYPDKATRRLFRAQDRKLAREERRNAARATMAAERLREEIARKKAA